ncbi:uncharacterized protein [Ptychodera flava]|uniref:uncharacterized protein isoform X1 n=1 Tax=Ptychodera flava TaxID=63121 RepID=UPI00396A2744
MSCMVYIVKQEKDIHLRVYLVKQFSGAEQWVEGEEKKVVPGGTKCEMTKSFTLMATGNDVEVEIDNVTDGWKLFPNDKKILLLPYGCLWDTDHYGCTFTLILDESCDASTMPSFRCTISIKQKGSDDGMQTEFAICQSPFQAQVTTPKRETKPASLPYSVRLELSHLLDFDHPLGNDWRSCQSG